jgi:hypothetical protein
VVACERAELSASVDASFALRREREKEDREQECRGIRRVAWPSGHHLAMVVGPPSAYGCHMATVA